jgi:hypothetical protein
MHAALALQVFYGMNKHLQVSRCSHLHPHILFSRWSSKYCRHNDEAICGHSSDFTTRGQRTGAWGSAIERFSWRDIVGILCW